VAQKFQFSVAHIIRFFHIMTHTNFLENLRSVIWI